MTVTLSFGSGFNPAKLVVKYGNNDNSKSETLNVENSATSVSFEISSEYKNSDGWLAVLSVTAYDSDDNEIENVECNSANNWFEFASGGAVSLEYGLVATGSDLYSQNYTGDGNVSCKLDSSSLTDLTIASLIVEATDCNWESVSGDWWIGVYSDTSWTKIADLAWIDNTHYKATITDSEKISSLKNTGIFIGASSGMTCTLTISYTTE
ncbi:MAG: hypothetical protein IJJ71_00610 [Treponema sp.]|uniref:hypothetical protein n=1 Tax=Treponema sp. TaxID=166 RepID=UPI0025D01C6E|nr:hypothetical protein [Treponema sp.]MBQ9623250.1 hypothetical protein [Treponema sp.]MBR0494661.1 hypothetical protein [Treponema sp.]